MKYFLKESLIPFIYLIFMALIAFAILMIGDNLLWLKYVLLVLNVGLYGVIVCAVFFKDGQDALKVRIANDLEREQIIKTGENRPLKLVEEYKPFKGFLIGLIVCIPLVIMLIIHTALVFGKNPELNGSGVAAGFLYLGYFAFFRANSAVSITNNMYYLSLIAIPAICSFTGISYIFGAKRIESQQQKIKETHESIYGDKK